jgi:hypothetical protein
LLPEDDQLRRVGVKLTLGDEFARAAHEEARWRLLHQVLAVLYLDVVWGIARRRRRRHPPKADLRRHLAL